MEREDYGGTHGLLLSYGKCFTKGVMGTAFPRKKWEVLYQGSDGKRFTKEVMEVLYQGRNGKCFTKEEMESALPRKRWEALYQGSNGKCFIKKLSDSERAGKGLTRLFLVFVLAETFWL